MVAHSCWGAVVDCSTVLALCVATALPGAKTKEQQMEPGIISAFGSRARWLTGREDSAHKRWCACAGYGQPRQPALECSDIDHITHRANSTLGFLRRNLNRCPSKLKETAFLSLCLSVLEYTASIWDPFRSKDKNSIPGVLAAPGC